MILQLHITGKCNLRCKHCYIDEHCFEMPYETVKDVLHQFEELTGAISKIGQSSMISEVHITGGEPFLHSEIDKILELLLEKKEKYRIGMMSNGTVLSAEVLETLKKLKMFAFQVSLDGNEETHDNLRGQGNFQEVLKGLDLLYERGIPTRVSFTANRENYTQFPEVAAVCREHHVSSLWSDRFIPILQDSILKPITRGEMEDYVRVLRREHENIANARAGLRVENYRALQFLGTQAMPYWCKAGEQLIVVDEYGNIMPCRRMPIVCGNVKRDSLVDVYFTNETFQELRKHEIDEKCKACRHVRSCKGGSRCMALAVTGSYTSADPCCYWE